MNTAFAIVGKRSHCLSHYRQHTHKRTEPFSITNMLRWRTSNLNQFRSFWRQELMANQRDKAKNGLVKDLIENFEKLLKRRGQAKPIFVVVAHSLSTKTPGQISYVAPHEQGTQMFWSKDIRYIQKDITFGHSNFLISGGKLVMIWSETVIIFYKVVS